MQSVNAFRQAEPYDMVFIVTGSPVQHIEDTFVIDYTRIAGDKVFPFIVRIRGNNGIAGIFDKFHIVLLYIDFQLNTTSNRTHATSRAPPHTR